MAGKGKNKKKKQRRRNSILVVFGLTVLAGIFFVTYCIRQSGGGPVLIPDGYNQFCIDISHHNGRVRDWDRLQIHVDAKGRIVASAEEAAQTYPVTMLYMKATEGISLVDRHFRENWTEARARRYAVGAYHFLLSDRDAAEQAQHYIRTVGPLRERDLAPVLDVESMHKGCTHAELNAVVRTWLTAVEEHYGKKPIIYTSDNFARRVLASDITSRYRIWVAHYGVDAPDYEGWSLWQFTDRGYVDGIDGYVDISVERQ